MKVLVDTNVFVSAVVWGGVPGEVVEFVVGDPQVEWIVSDEILREYVNVLRRPKFGLPEELVARWQQLLADETVLIHVKAEIAFPRDPADSIFLSCALDADADFLITGDRDFEQARLLGNTKIISATLFKRLVSEDSTEKD